MELEIRDYNGSDTVIATTHAGQWADVESVLTAMPLHLKASDQKGKQGNPIFDPKGTNRYIRKELVDRLKWRGAIPIPGEFDFLGTDIDYGKDGMIMEVQFSNYPFLLNNMLRAEFFFQSKTLLTGKPTGVSVIVTKGGMFPSSNSTLYYEQAVKQLDALHKFNMFNVPIRLIGLVLERVAVVNATWTEYDDPRYSRTVVSETTRRCSIGSGRTAGVGPCSLRMD